MALFDWFTGTKRPAAGVAAKPAAEVRGASLSANSRPFGNGQFVADRHRGT